MGAFALMLTGVSCSNDDTQTENTKTETNDENVVARPYLGQAPVLDENGNMFDPNNPDLYTRYVKCGGGGTLVDGWAVYTDGVNTYTTIHSTSPFIHNTASTHWQSFTNGIWLFWESNWGGSCSAGRPATIPLSEVKIDLAARPYLGNPPLADDNGNSLDPNDPLLYTKYVRCNSGGTRQNGWAVYTDGVRTYTASWSTTMWDVNPANSQWWTFDGVNSLWWESSWGGSCN